MKNAWILSCGVAFGLAGCGDDTTGSTGTDGESDDAAGTGDDDDDDADETAGACDDPFELTCPDDVTVECEGPQTTVELDEPVAACADWEVTREGGDAFDVGQTNVTFNLDGDGMSESCTTQVTVTDSVGPELVCPAMEVFVRPDPDAIVAVPSAMATDVCSADVDVGASPAELPTGTTQVEYTATDGSGNTSTCSVELAVIDVFAPQQFQVVDATLLGNGATEVTFGWEPFDSSLVSGYRLESGPAEDGPWTEVATAADDEELLTLELPEDAAYYRMVTTSGAGDGGATPARPVYAIADAAYDIRDVPVPTVQFLTTLYGVVRHPVALSEGPFPLVVMLHGNHGNCRSAPDDPNDYCSTSQDHECALGDFTTPNAEGLAYLAETLAAQGMVAVTISGNAMNCRDDFIFERSQLIGEHLRFWQDWNDGTGEFAGTFQNALDLTRVGLFGHSRGGDAVSNVPGILANTPIPGVAVRSIFSLAPTDFHQVEVRDTNLAVLLPSCDGDVFNLIGMDHYDRSTDFDDGVHQSQLMFIGANHNFFNTEWQISDQEFQPPNPFCTPDDAYLMQVQQHSLSALLGPWFLQTLEDDAPVDHQRADAPQPGFYDSYAGADLDWRWSYSSNERTVIDAFEGNNSPGQNGLGGNNTFTDWLLAERCNGQSCDPNFFHDQWVMRLLWDETNTAPSAALELAGLDASAAEALSFRVVSRVSTLNTGLDTQEFTIRVTDSGGEQAELLLSDVKTIEHLYPGNAVREILETVRVPTAMLSADNPALDLGSLALLELEMTAMPTGSVIVTDFELAL